VPVVLAFPSSYRQTTVTHPDYLIIFHPAGAAGAVKEYSHPRGSPVAPVVVVLVVMVAAVVQPARALLAPVELVVLAATGSLGLPV